MNKNLKKVISAVAALAISASAVSALAVNFPDVAEDASYYQAVQELSALDVISGYDDGTFRPDELVTRAQMSKMIVDALNHRELAEASKSESKFNDVAADHWARGYINQGVADKFIAGYSDTEFGPEDNVTYVQAQVMLVSATGYKTYAEGSGGWPNGYKTWANSQGITAGISGIADDAQLTRAQVAQLIDNAMGAPICVIKDYETTWDGRQVPNLEIKDKEGKEYQTLFTKQHKAYKVYGRVTDTSKTNNGLKNDQVTFRVEKADNFDDTYIKANSGDEVTEDMYYGTTNAADLLRTYAEALVQKNDDDEWVILSIAPAAANKSETVLTEDVNEDKSTAQFGGSLLYFYPAGTNKNAKKYELATDDNGALAVDVYLNGVALNKDNMSVEDAIMTYIINDDTNIVTLQKETKTGSTSTDSKYNVIMISTFGTAVVESVSDKSNETKISFKEKSVNKANMVLKKDDDTVRYSFTLNGEEIDPAELQEDDVLTIAYDLDDFAESNFYDVIVSRDTVEGKYTGVNNTGDEFTIGGTKYKAANGMGYDKDTFATSSEYTIYLDAFGRIAYHDEIDSTKKLGILTSVYMKNNGDFVAEVISREATKSEYTLDDDEAVKIAKEFDGKINGDDADDYNGNDNIDAFVSGLGKTVGAYANQVVEYKVNSSNKLTIKNFMGGNPVEDGEYKVNSKKISGTGSSIKLSDASTIIDLSSTKNTTSVDEYSLISLDGLKDGATYTAVGYDKNRNDSTSRFVLILSGTEGIDEYSQMSVFLEAGTDTDEEGTDVDTITVLNNGEQTTYMIDEDAKIDVDDFQEGDLVVFSTNSEDKIDELQAVFADYGFVGTDYSDVRSAFEDFAKDAKKNPIFSETLELEHEYTDETVNYYAGAVVNKSGSSYTVAPVQVNDDGEYFVDLNGGQDITVSSNTKVYTYNYDKSKKNFGRISADDGMAVTPDVKNAYEGQDKANSIYYIDNDEVANDVVYAIVRTFDTDEAQEVYLIVAE